MALVDTALRGLKPENKPKKYSDGGGLFLMVNPNGSKLWRLAYRFDGKQKTLAFGAYPKVTLADARALAAGSIGKDKFGYRGEFLRLIDLAKAQATTSAK